MMKKKLINQMVNGKTFIMTTALSVAVTLFMLPVMVNGQVAKTNFSGTWVFNETKSNLGEGRGFRAAAKLTIMQEGNNLSVERERTNQNGETVNSTDKYTLDGKECVNTSTRGTSKSVVTWSAGDKGLNFATTRTFERDGQTTEMKTNEVWTLTDPNTFSILSTGTFQGEERKATLVYDKK